MFEGSGICYVTRYCRLEFNAAIDERLSQDRFIQLLSFFPANIVIKQRPLMLQSAENYSRCKIRVPCDGCDKEEPNMLMYNPLEITDA